MNSTQTTARKVTIPGSLPDALAETDTSDLAALLALSNPWFTADASFWLKMADSLKQFVALKVADGSLVPTESLSAPLRAFNEMPDDCSNPVGRWFQDHAAKW